jgi:hypothetical protein
VAVRDPPLGYSPGSRSGDVLKSEDVAQGAAPEPNVGRRRHERQRDPGKDQSMVPTPKPTLSQMIAAGIASEMSTGRARRTMDDTGAPPPNEYPRLP